jgi:hypothetical protein
MRKGYCSMDWPGIYSGMWKERLHDNLLWNQCVKNHDYDYFFFRNHNQINIIMIKKSRGPRDPEKYGPAATRAELSLIRLSEDLAPSRYLAKYY